MSTTMFSVFPLRKALQSWISRKSIWRYPFWKTSHFISLAQWLCVCLIYLTVRLFYSLWSVVYLIQIISLFSVTYIFNHLGNTSSSSRISTWQEKLASYKSRKAGLSESQIKMVNLCFASWSFLCHDWVFSNSQNEGTSTGK